MGKQNFAYLYARVHTPPQVSFDKETGEYHHGMFYADVVRGPRAVGDNLHFVKHDKPLIMSKEKQVLDLIKDLKVNDIVLIKGVVTSASIMKTTFCDCIDDETGEKTKNKSYGNMLYVTPIYLKKLKSYGDDKEAAVQDVVDNSEISNQVSVVGTLITEPRLYTTKKGLQITQYALAINRKFLIRTDNPEYKTDWPVVKSYGEQARSDKVFLRQKAEVMIDGFLQARTVKRKTKCHCCGKIYEWEDHAMEIVPYAVEYLNGQRSQDEVEAETHKTAEELKQE
nr:single-stranded DNA-binding protein [Oscillospiraceae bacterium]